MKERGLATKKEGPHSQPVKGDVKLGQVHPANDLQLHNQSVFLREFLMHNLL